MFKKVDLVIIGGGPAGYEAAFKAADGGMKAIIIEKEAIGGTCLNHGCIPTKTIMHSTELYKKLETIDEFGIALEKKSINFEVIQNRKEEILEKLRNGILSRIRKSDIEVVLGEGKIVSNNLVRVGDETIETKFILIATGTGTLLPPIKGCDLDGVITSDELLEYNKKPFGALTIIGGGVIGMEFANMFSDVGTSITVIEALDRILPNMDKELGQSLKMILKKRGVDIHTSSFVEEIIKSNEGLSCKYKEKGKEAVVTSDAVLIAVGRKPNINNLYAADVELEIEKGCIKVNDNYQTNYPNIYAVGDVIGGIQLAHVASAEGKNAVYHMLGKEDRIDVNVIPSCIYTNPEIASVGITADDAKRENIKIIANKFPMLANGKTILSGMDRGYIKIIADEKSHKILGAQMMCGRATDLISELTVAIANELTLEDLKKVIHPHPTFSEGIGDALN
ncbi:MAG: dihydrolipoyl dehydrogenase [Peptostreptococcaceae bacterium]|nr:dihydrolipoyl dehydrogenase [Peptostreptococcaceae bacterium]